MPRPKSRRLVYESTSTGNSTGTAAFEVGMQAAAAICRNASTKPITWKMVGGIGGSTVWTALSTTVATTGASALTLSTVTATFDSLKIQVTANDRTSTDTGDCFFWVTAR